MKIMTSRLVPMLEAKLIYARSVMSNRVTKITTFAVIIIILATGSSNALIEQVVKAQNRTANTTDQYLGNKSQFDDSGRISSREPIACPMC
jgi:hypothetical protein